jgi:hypothetical protein
MEEASYVMKRRWFRYSLRTLLVLVALSAAAIGWYTHRQRMIKAERAKLLGGWVIAEWHRGDFGTYGNPIQLSETDFSVGVPNGDIGTIDFRATPGEHSKGIYRIVGNTLQVAQNDVGKPRPTTFDDRQADSVWTATRIDSANKNQQTTTTQP